MNYDTQQELEIDFSKLFTNYKKVSNIKQCIWGGDKKEGCKGDIVSAHSIQRGKILSSIADNGYVTYIGINPDINTMDLQPIFKKMGIQAFSTFYGFCSEHDKKVFKCIEDESFTPIEKKMNTYAYRAVAKELHTNMQGCKFLKAQIGNKMGDLATLPLTRGETYTVPDSIKKAMIEMYINERLRNQEHNVKELQLICNHLKDVLDDKVENQIEHIYYSFNDFYQVVCCTSFIPYFDHRGKEIMTADEKQAISNIVTTNISDIKSAMLNVFPEAGKTHIIFSFPKKNIKFKDSIQGLFNVNSDKYIKKSLSLIMLNYAENMAFNPNYIDKNFNNVEKESIKTIFFKNLRDPLSFTKKNINLFR